MDIHTDGVNCTQDELKQAGCRQDLPVEPSESRSSKEMRNLACWPIYQHRHVWNGLTDCQHVMLLIDFD